MEQELYSLYLHNEQELYPLYLHCLSNGLSFLNHSTLV